MNRIEPDGSNPWIGCRKGSSIDNAEGHPNCSFATNGLPASFIFRRLKQPGKFIYPVDFEYDSQKPKVADPVSILNKPVSLV